MKTLRVLLLFAAVIALNSCAVEEEIDNTKLLTQKTWTYDSVSGYDDFTNQFLDAFLTSSTYKFDEDGTYTATLLGQSAGGGTWSFNSDETKITVGANGSDPETWTIITLSETTLKVSGEDDSALDGTYTLTFK